MLDARIPIFVTPTKNAQSRFFPFIQGGVCSQLTEEEALALKDKLFPLGDFYIRCAQPNDTPFLYDLLRAYGNHTDNYEDLEQFPEAKMDLIVKNISLCWTHRFFISFLLFWENKPIAFFQVDPYRIETITSNFNNKLLPAWSQCFVQKLMLEELTNLNFADRLQWLYQHFVESAFHSCLSIYHFAPHAPDWLNFVAISLETYKQFCHILESHHWIGNISYNLFPEFQRQGLMSNMISICSDALAQNTHCKYLFSDRIADKNIASIKLLQNLNFQVGGTFFSYYGPEYHTRKHPNGNFSESCICFYKKIA